MLRRPAFLVGLVAADLLTWFGSLPWWAPDIILGGALLLCLGLVRPVPWNDVRAVLLIGLARFARYAWGDQMSRLDLMELDVAELMGRTILTVRDPAGRRETLAMAREFCDDIGRNTFPLPGAR